MFCDDQYSTGEQMGMCLVISWLYFCVCRRSNCSGMDSECCWYFYLWSVPYTLLTQMQYWRLPTTSTYWEILRNSQTQIKHPYWVALGSFRSFAGDSWCITSRYVSTTKSTLEHNEYEMKNVKYGWKTYTDYTVSLQIMVADHFLLMQTHFWIFTNMDKVRRI